MILKGDVMNEVQKGGLTTVSREAGDGSCLRWTVFYPAPSCRV